MKPIRISAILPILVSACLSAGCDPLTRNRFDMIVIDVSTKDDVRRTIGDPSDGLGPQWIYSRPDRHLTVMINFNPQHVVNRKQWVDASNNEWVDTLVPGDTDTSETTTIRRVD